MATLQKKVRTKKHSPKRQQDLYQRSATSKCFLYRWLGEEIDDMHYHVKGPYTDSQNVSLINWAKKTNNSWQGVIISSFMDAKGNYYEESIELPVQKNIKLSKLLPEILDIVNAACESTRSCGPATQYIDTVISWRLDNRALQAKLNNDDWVKEQASFRADQLIDLQVEKLESLVNEVNN